MGYFKGVDGAYNVLIIDGAYYKAYIGILRCLLIINQDGILTLAYNVLIMI